MTKYEQLVQKAKDCGVHYGIYSPQYASAIHEMNDYWLANQPVKLTFKEKIEAKKQNYLKAWKHKKY